MNRKKRIFITMALTTLIVMCFSQLVTAESYPSKPVKAIVPYGVGGITDLHARFVQKALKGNLSQPLVVVNVPGGASMIGTRKAKDSPADGYTTLTTVPAILTTEALGIAGFNPMEAFIPVAQTGVAPVAMVVRKDSPFKNLKDVLEAAKAKPNSVKDATNIGAFTHFVSLSLCKAAGNIEFRYIQVGGDTKKVASVLGGHSDFAWISIPAVMPLYKSGDVRVLCVFSDKRHPNLPEVPTPFDAGYKNVEILEVGIWWFMPAGSPQDAVDTMADKLEQAMQSEGLIADYKKLGTQPVFLKGNAFRQKLENKRKAIKSLAKDVKLKKKE